MDTTVVQDALHTAYGITFETLTFLPVGFAAACFRARDRSGLEHFVKLWADPRSAMADASRRERVLQLMHAFAERDLRPAVPAPSRTLDGALWATDGVHPLAVFAFVQGSPLSPTPDERMQRRLGRAIADVHAATGPLADVLPPRERFVLRFQPDLRAAIDAVQRSAGAPALRDRFLPRLGEIAVALERLHGLQRAVAGLPGPFVLCHTDMSGDNVLVREEGELVAVDWDDAMVAPPEADLWAAAPDTLIAYFDSGGTRALHAERFAFYLLRRALEDMTARLVRLLDPTTDERDHPALLDELDRWGFARIAAVDDDLARINAVVSAGPVSRSLATPSSTSLDGTDRTEQATRSFLIGRLGAEPASVQALRPGEWSSVYSIRRRGEDLIVRFSRYRDDFEKDRAVAARSSPELPVPAVLEIGEALGLAYAVSRRVRGEFLETLDEARTRAVLPRLFAALDAARAVDLSSTTGFGGWTVEGGGLHATWRDALLAEGESVPPERAAGWRDRLEGSPTGAGAFDEARARMRELVTFCPEERHLIHDDLLNRNVLVERGHITAVLDWGSSKYGDFLYDIASLVFWRPWFPAWSTIDFLAEAARHYALIGLEVAHLEERVRCYAVKIGLGGMSYNAWKGRERWEHLARIAARTLEFART